MKPSLPRSLGPPDRFFWPLRGTSRSEKKGDSPCDHATRQNAAQGEMGDFPSDDKKRREEQPDGSFVEWRWREWVEKFETPEEAHEHWKKQAKQARQAPATKKRPPLPPKRAASAASAKQRARYTIDERRSSVAYRCTTSPSPSPRRSAHAYARPSIVIVTGTTPFPLGRSRASVRGRRRPASGASSRSPRLEGRHLG